MVLTSNKKIFLTGGSGRLGRELRKLDPDIIAPTSKECDILDLEQIKKNIDFYEPDIFVHAAANTDVVNSEADPIDCVQTNVMGTINVLKACKEKNIKLIYISTDYVFDGKKGNYGTEDPINPLTNYAKTKAAGELIVRTYSNHLVIRTSFYGHNFPYSKALIDQWSTKDYVDVMAPKILSAIKGSKNNIIHIGSARRTTYEIARERRPDVIKTSIEDLGLSIPKDVSLKTT